MARSALSVASIVLLAACGGGADVPERVDVVSSLSTVADGPLLRAREVTLRRSDGERAFSVDALLNVEVTGFRSSALANNRSLAAGPSLPPPGQRAALLEDDAINTGLDNPGRQSGLAFRFVTSDGIPSSISNREGPDLFLFELGLPGGERGEGGFAALPGDPLTVRGVGLESDRTATFGTGSYIVVGADRRVEGVERFSNVGADEPASPVFTLEELEQADLQSLGRSDLNLFGLAIDLDDLGYASDESVQGLELLRLDGIQSPDPCLILGLPDTVSR